MTRNPREVVASDLFRCCGYYSGARAICTDNSRTRPVVKLLAFSDGSTDVLCAHCKPEEKYTCDLGRHYLKFKRGQCPYIRGEK